jgi:surface polysaccharide O-acyltransferase-like enzyme
LSRWKIIGSAVVWLISTFTTIFGTYLLSRTAEKFDSFFYDFVSLNTILASGAAFLLLRWLSGAKPFALPNVQALMRALATSAFGIYLIHVLVIEVLHYHIPYLQISSLMGNALWGIPFVSLIVFSLSFLIVRLLQKIPVLNAIVP